MSLHRVKDSSCLSGYNPGNYLLVQKTVEPLQFDLTIYNFLSQSENRTSSN